MYLTRLTIKIDLHENLRNTIVSPPHHEFFYFKKATKLINKNFKVLRDS